YCLVGEWTAKDAAFTAGGKKHKTAVHVSCAPAASGYALECTATFDIDGIGHSEETDLFGYDPGQNRYHWFSVSSMQETHDHVALPPADGQPIVWSYSGVLGGQPLHEVLRMTFDRDGKKLDFDATVIVAAEAQATLTASMVK